MTLKRHRLSKWLVGFVLSFLLVLSLVTIASLDVSVLASESAAIQAPLLKWQRGGCFSSWCQTGWYASPAVADLDDDGQPEVIWASYDLVVLNGQDGSEQWRVDPPGDRQWPGVVVADLQGDGDLEIVTAHGDGYLHVFDHQGNRILTRQPTPGRELRSLAVYDFEGDGDLEIIVASTRSDDQWWVYHHDGSAYGGQWPQHAPDSKTNGYSAGAYNENIALADLDADGRAEIIGPSDVHYITAYQDSGAQIRANAIYDTNPDGSNKFWSRVGVHVDHAVDLRGYANCGQEHRPNFAHSAPIIVDVNGDGVLEVVVVGNVYNCGTSPYTSLYEMPFIFNADRTRWSGNGYDWTAIPVPDGQARPLTQDYGVIENAQPNPVAADLDGDGLLEILYASYDGRVHAYWLDKTEHGDWPYSVYEPAEGFYRFASEPAVVDLDDDGKAEIIFASWPQKGGNRVGKLHILNYLGQELHEVNLPLPHSGDWNGGLGGPTLANVDADADLEVVLGTAHSGAVVYDLPGTAGARILWGTGRGNYQRSGSNLVLNNSIKGVNVGSVDGGDPLAYTIQLRTPGPLVSGVQLTDTLPAGIVYQGGLWASSGLAQESAGTITWSGDVDLDTPVTISFNALASPGSGDPQTIVNIAWVSDGLGKTFPVQAAVIVNARDNYIPMARR